MPTCSPKTVLHCTASLASSHKGHKLDICEFTAARLNACSYPPWAQSQVVPLGSPQHPQRPGIEAKATLEVVAACS